MSSGRQEADAVRSKGIRPEVARIRSGASSLASKEPGLRPAARIAYTTAATKTTAATTKHAFRVRPRSFDSIGIIASYSVRRLQELRSAQEVRCLHWPGTVTPFEITAGCHILKMPKRVSSMGAFAASERPSARIIRVSTGSITPSSQRRAVEW